MGENSQYTCIVCWIMWAALWITLRALKKCDRAKTAEQLGFENQLKSRSSVKLLGGHSCSVWFVMIKGSWVLKQSERPESPPHPPSLNSTPRVDFLSETLTERPSSDGGCCHCFAVKHILLVVFVSLLATVEFRSSMDGGVCSQEPSMKSSLTLSTKKSVTYPADLQDTPAKPPLYHKQPPALPPKPFSRIPNHSTGRYSGFKVDLFTAPPLHPPRQNFVFSLPISCLSGCHLPSPRDNKSCCCFKLHLCCHPCAQD